MVVCYHDQQHGRQHYGVDSPYAAQQQLHGHAVIVGHLSQYGHVRVM